MPSVEELLSVAEVDADTRIIRMMPQDELFGVESDEKSERKYFKVPKIVGNGVLNGTIKSDGYIRKVAVNIIDYSMKIIDHQFFKDDNGILQVAKNEGWAYYRDVSLYAGHSYVFVSSDEVTVTNLVYENNIELSRD